MTASNLLALLRNYSEALDAPEARGFIDAIDWDMAERRLEPTSLPCLKHLDRACAMAPEPEKRLVVSLAENRALLRWGQTYLPTDLGSDFGRNFLASYGWMELFGTRGHFVNEEIAAGFLVLGSNTHYPEHHHIAEEIYVPLTPGTKWRKGEEGAVRRKPGEVIHHPSNVSHAMLTGEEPLVALYFWRGGPLDQKSVFASRPSLEGRPGAEVEPKPRDPGRDESRSAAS